jgi:translation initiation factor 2 gamma subunit (eIF-2gamma)
MAEDDNNLTLRLLREIREAQTATDSKVDAIGAKLDSTSAKLDKLTVGVIGVQGRLRKVEEGMEAIAGVLSRELDLLK